MTLISVLIAQKKAEEEWCIPDHFTLFYFFNFFFNPLMNSSGRI